MSEAVGAVLRFAFRCEDTQGVVASTDPDNAALQNILRKIGFTYLGLIERAEPALRGGPQVTSWQLIRSEYRA
jgi:RimJ/RimL family protein N-acetyltransferase